MTGISNATAAANRVDFLICGTQKGGTSALDIYLRRHAQLCMAERKELHFFDDETAFQNGSRPDCLTYHSAFKRHPSHKLLGESTPIYMYWHPAPRRIWQYNPYMKLIVLLRNPITRAYSHWNMERLRNADDKPFWLALLNEAERCRVALPDQHRVYSYVDRGFYLEQLRRLWMYFPRDQVLPLRSEALRRDPDATLQQVWKFLGVECVKAGEAVDAHSLPYPCSMEARAKEYLRGVFEHEIRALERVLGWDCSDWMSE